MGKYEIFKNRTRFILKEPLYAEKKKRWTETMINRAFFFFCLLQKECFNSVYNQNFSIPKLHRYLVSD